MGPEDGSSANKGHSLASAAKIPHVSPDKRVMADLLQNRLLNPNAPVQFKGIPSYIQQAMLPCIPTVGCLLHSERQGKRDAVLKTRSFLPLFAHKQT